MVVMVRVVILPMVVMAVRVDGNGGGGCGTEG